MVVIHFSSMSEPKMKAFAIQEKINILMQVDAH
jgi:hypothetical protein